MLASLAIQWRVVKALLLREVITRYGRHNIGFLWLFVEPMLFTLGVTAIWSLTKTAHGSNTPIVPFALTGYSSVLLWRTTASRCPKALEANLSLLFHRNVRALDVFVARILLELLGTTMSFALLTVAFRLVGLLEWPDDIVSVFSGWAALSLFAAGLGLSIGALSEVTELLDRIWHTITYLVFPFSGAVFMVDWLPGKAKQFALALPMVHATEWIRHGFFGDGVKTYEDPPYLIGWALALVATGLFFVGRVSRNIEPE